MQFRLMTYNIHKGIGGIDRRYSLERIIEVIRQYESDIVFLQEVDEGVPRSRHDRQIELLSEELGYPHFTYQRNVPVKQGHYGNAILSRYPLGPKLDVDLRVSIKKRRGALITRAEITGDDARSCSMLLCNAHLGLSGFERAIQIKRILRREELQPADEPAIVGGDFNDVWGEHGRKLMFPSQFHCAVSRAKTFPAALPVRSLDAIYYRGNLRLVGSFTGNTRLARRASDHLPVIADFEVEGGTREE
jgi:endonuclease/exonuclease/phosphatase family metal-dependent hydrolase